MGSPYIKPQSPPGYNNNPPQDDGSQVTDNQLEWQKHLDKIGDPLKTHTEGEADATENAFNGRLLNNTIQTTVNYTAQVADRGKLIVGTSDAIAITLPDATDPQITDGFEYAIYCFITDGNENIDPTKSIKIEGTGGQTVNGFGDWPLKSGEFALCTSSGGNWIALASYYVIPPDPPAPGPFTTYATSATQALGNSALITVAWSAFTPALSGPPKFLLASLNCTTAQYEYVPGDVIPLPGYVVTTRGVQFWKGATEAKCRIGAQGIYLSDGGVEKAITNANFNLFFQAFD